MLGWRSYLAFPCCCKHMSDCCCSRCRSSRPPTEKADGSLDHKPEPPPVRHLFRPVHIQSIKQSIPNWLCLKWQRLNCVSAYCLHDELVTMNTNWPSFDQPLFWAISLQPLETMPHFYAPPKYIVINAHFLILVLFPDPTCVFSVKIGGREKKEGLVTQLTGLLVVTVEECENPNKLWKQTLTLTLTLTLTNTGNIIAFIIPALFFFLNFFLALFMWCFVFKLALGSITVLCTGGSCIATEMSVVESDILTSETELLLPMLSPHTFQWSYAS